MAAHAGAEEFVPESRDLDGLRSAAAGCRGCGLYRDATQTVFGDGPAEARVIMVGEQPGDREDRTGEPFVGPAGGLLDKALEEAGIDRGLVYVTNAVKHFKFTLPERGKRRIHQKPSRTEIVACRPWLVAEIESIRPDVVICLGATAAQSLLGSSFRVTQHRGELIGFDAGDLPSPPKVLATVHPASVLRAPDEDRKKAYADLVADLSVAAKAV